MMEEGKTSSTLGWFRAAKDKFRAFAYGEQSEPRERPRVGLALAGGFARGIAHLGVLRVLRDAGIPIDCVGGTSVGALIAVGYCAGASLEEMVEVGAATSFSDFGRWTPSWVVASPSQDGVQRPKSEKLVAAPTSTISSSDAPAQYPTAISAPTLVPPTQSMGIPASRKTRSTPRCAIPRANPPARAKPTRGRSRGSLCSPYAKARNLSFAVRNQPRVLETLPSSAICPF